METIDEVLVPSETESKERTASSLRALLRATRDLVLIVLGVLLALAADSWRENRQDRRAELVMLTAMRSALASDLSSLGETVTTFERAEATNLFLQQYMAAGQSYADSLDALFGVVYATGALPPLNLAPYEALKARGLQLVSSEPLRVEIIEVYENTYGVVRRQNDFNVNVVFDILRPYYLTHFRDLRFGQSATPLDYEVLRRDQYFRNVLAYRADFVNRAVITYYKNAMESIEGLIDALDEELGQAG